MVKSGPDQKTVTIVDDILTLRKRAVRMSKAYLTDIIVVILAVFRKKGWARPTPRSLNQY
jgi:hypothetical protein